MSIEEYKNAIMDLVEKLEKEHGCCVKEIRYEKTTKPREFTWPTYNITEETVKIEL